VNRKRCDKKSEALTYAYIQAGFFHYRNLIKNGIIMIKKIHQMLYNSYSSLISFIVYHFECWLWKDVQPIPIYKFYSETTGEYCEARREG